MPAVGLEPTRGHPRKILSLVRLPFRHAGWLWTLGEFPKGVNAMYSIILRPVCLGGNVALHEVPDLFPALLCGGGKGKDEGVLVGT